MKAEHVLYAKKEINYNLFLYTECLFLMINYVKDCSHQRHDTYLKNCLWKVFPFYELFAKTKLIKGSFIEEMMYSLLYDSLNYIS